MTSRSRAGAPAGANGAAKEVVIVGGGIGGLTMANALDRVGIDFQLYERAPEITEVGAGIGLSKGALDLLDMLGLGEEVRERGRWIRNVFLADKRMRVRRRVPATTDSLCVHRAALVDVLAGRLPAERIHLSSTVEDVRSHHDRAEIRFTDGRTVTTGCAIAADGIHSVVRKRLFPDVTPRFIQQTIWRGISRTDVPPLLRDSYIEVWDEGLRFLTVPIREGETFWLAVKPAPPGERDDPTTVRDDLLRLFRNFHPVFLDLIRDSQGFLRDDMADLGPPGGRPWHHERFALLGDAIHATTPNLAQGGCQAMEDAVCLARCLRTSGGEPARAFPEYQRLRQKKVEFIVNTSWNFGVAAHSRNPLRHHLFRALLEWTPAPFLRRQERLLNDISYLPRP